MSANDVFDGAINGNGGSHACQNFDGQASGRDDTIESTMGPRHSQAGSSVSVAPAPTESKPGSVVVNIEACRSLAELLRSQHIPAAREDIPVLWMSPEQVGNFYLLLVAICYQTSPRGRPPLEGDVEGRHLHGWDYLSAKLEAAARNKSTILSPAVWANISAEEVRELFRDDALGDRLSDPHQRAFFIRDLGQQMLRHSWECASQIYDVCKGCIVEGDPNLLSCLAQFRAYDDPVRKKSYFFLELMQNTGLWKYADPEQLGAPVDYHEVRGHLRIGTVEIYDSALREKIIASKEVSQEEDVEIRRAVFKALMWISEYSGLRNPGQLHYLFWNVFRSCCTRENPHCDACPPKCSLPTRYAPLALAAGPVRHCPFSSVCRSAGREPKLIEHIVETYYY